LDGEFPPGQGDIQHHNLSMSHQGGFFFVFIYRHIYLYSLFFFPFADSLGPLY
jgi:hypothetical protein